METTILDLSCKEFLKLGAIEAMIKTKNDQLKRGDEEILIQLIYDRYSLFVEILAEEVSGSPGPPKRGALGGKSYLHQFLNPYERS